jgi:hypothetical protein
MRHPILHRLQGLPISVTLPICANLCVTHVSGLRGMSTYDVSQPLEASVKYCTVAGSSVLNNICRLRLGSISLSFSTACSYAESVKTVDSTPLSPWRTNALMQEGCRGAPRNSKLQRWQRQQHSSRVQSLPGAVSPWRTKALMQEGCRGLPWNSKLQG